MYQIGEDVVTIHKLSEFSFEAMEVYKNTLNLTMAIQEGQRLLDIQKRKKEHEEALAKQKAEEETRIAASVPDNPSESLDNPQISDAESIECGSDVPVQEALQGEVIQLDFRVWGTREQILMLRDYMKENHLKFGKVE